MDIHRVSGWAQILSAVVAALLQVLAAFHGGMPDPGHVAISIGVGASGVETLKKAK